jgi:hypothetical protein
VEAWEAGIFWRDVGWRPWEDTPPLLAFSIYRYMPTPPLPLIALLLFYGLLPGPPTTAEDPSEMP